MAKFTPGQKVFRLIHYPDGSYALGQANVVRTSQNNWYRYRNIRTGAEFSERGQRFYATGSEAIADYFRRYGIRNADALVSFLGAWGRGELVFRKSGPKG